MKKLLLLPAFFISLLTFAQVPQGISYQAIALDGSGVPVVSSNVGIRLSILDSSVSGTVLYTETHTAVTNAQGLFNLIIGQGIPTVGIFSAIKWETNSKFLKVEMDTTGGTTYVLVGTTQLWSVPYAQFAGKVDSENITGGPDVSHAFFQSYSSSFMTSTNAYVYSEGTELADSGTPPNNYAWYSTPISGTPFMKSQNSFLTSTNAYIFAPSTDDPNGLSSWHNYPISGQPFKIFTYSPYTTTVVTSTNIYMYRADTGGTYNWISAPISGPVVDAIGSCVVTATTIYAYDAITSSWTSTPISGTFLKIKYSSSGLMVFTSSNVYIYGPNVYDNNYTTTPTYSWHTLPISGTLLLD